MTISKNNPLGPLPPYDFAGSARDWAGQPLLWSDATDLPVLYTTENAVLLPGSPTIRLTGSGRNARFLPVRRPNVLFHFSAQSIAASISANSNWLARADALGLIVADLPDPPGIDDLPGRVTSRALLAGLPALGGAAMPAERYSGGRVMSVVALGASTYVESISDDEYSYDAPAEDAGYCVTVDPPGQYGAGTATIPTVANVGININYTFVQDHYDELADDLDFLDGAAARFDRLRVVAQFNAEETVSADVQLEGVCFDTVGAANALVQGSGLTTITNSSYVAAVNARSAITAAEITGSVAVAAEAITIEEILTFFEED